MGKHSFSASIFYILIIFIAFIIHYFSNIDISKISPTRPIVSSLIIALLLGLAVVLLSQILNLYLKSFQKLESAFIKLLFPISIQHIFFLSIFSAIGEELLFRGILLQKIGLFFSSLIFGLIHFIPDKNFIPWTLFALILGFGLGYIFIFTGHIVAAILCHFTINFCNMLFLYVKFQKQKI